MKPQGKFKRRVLVGAGLAAVAVVGWIFWSRSLEVDPGAAQRRPEPFVRVASPGEGTADQVLRERAVLYDPTPLFFPTEWNYGQRPLPTSLERQPGQVFGSFEPKFTFTDTKLRLYGAEAFPVPEKLSDVLVQGHEAPFAGFGQIDTPRMPLPVRAGFIEVTRLADSKPSIVQSLNELRPPRLDYAPLEFLVVVGSGGVVGEPILTSGSGWDEVDTFFRTYLVKTFWLGQRLAPGRYRVAVGP